MPKHELEKRKDVDQKRQAVRRLLADRPDLFSSQGAVVETWRENRGRRLGPYYRLAYRDGARQRSLYLGRDPGLAEEVRGELDRLQAPAHHERRRRRQRKTLRRELARLRADWRRELKRAGLDLHGGEVRGWRRVRHARRSTGHRLAVSTSIHTESSMEGTFHENDHAGD